MTTEDELAPDRHPRMQPRPWRALRARNERRRQARKATVTALKAQQLGVIRRDGEKNP